MQLMPQIPALTTAGPGHLFTHAARQSLKTISHDGLPGGGGGTCSGMGFCGIPGFGFGCGGNRPAAKPFGSVLLTGLPSA